MNFNHYLHSSHSHDITRHWHSSGFDNRNLVYPLFISDANSNEEIPSMPKQMRISISNLEEFLLPLYETGLRAVILFGCISKNKKTVNASNVEQVTPVTKALQIIRDSFPKILRIVDVCLCPYTTTGHCHLFTSNNQMDIGSTVSRLAEISLFFAENGAQIIAPSDMISTRIKFIKEALLLNGHVNVGILSYSCKFFSCLYSPFRDAVDSAPAFGDRRDYQLPPSKKLALKACLRDEKEGADFLMVKPSLFNLDVCAFLSENISVPLAAYIVSGEYALIMNSANILPTNDLILEIVEGFKRAGVKVIISYFVPDLLNDPRFHRACFD